jgi:hypothetical protein
MAHSLEVETTIPFSFPRFLSNFFDSRNEINTLLSHALFSSKLNMDQKIYRRISDNIYQTFQEHKEASRELRKIQFIKGQSLFEKMQNSRNDQISFAKSVAQIN